MGGQTDCLACIIDDTDPVAAEPTAGSHLHIETIFLTAVNRCLQYLTRGSDHPVGQNVS